MEKVWRDIHIMRIFYLSLSIGIISLIIYYFLIKEPKQNKIILASLIGSYSIFILFNIIRTKLTYITKDGIRVGNAPNDSYDNFKFGKNAVFLEWNDLKSIKIIRKQVHRPFHDVLRNYITINTKQDKKYESFIADPKGLLKILKDLKKEKLISKDSKYRDIIEK